MELGYSENDMIFNDIFFGDIDCTENVIGSNNEISDEDSLPQDFNLEETLIDETDICVDYICPEDSIIIQNNFVNFMKSQELHLYKETFIEKYFTSYKCPTDHIVQRTRTQLWMENCIYGLQLQAYICMVKDIPLPIVPQRNRKQPILKKKNLTQARKGVFQDVVLEYLFQKCRNVSEFVSFRHRDAPRNQIGLLIFILDLLNHPYYKGCIRWVDKGSLIFKIINSKLVAYYWMVVKENDTCNIENFARGIRYLRRVGFFKQINKKAQRTYQFNKKAIKEYEKKRLTNNLTNALLNNLN